MINQESVKQAMDLAKMATEAGLTITAQPGTPLYELCTNTKLLGDPVVTSMESLDSVPENLSEASDNTPHNVRFDYFAKQIVESCAAHLSFAKNVVVAAIVSTSNRVMTDLGAQERNPVQEFQIVTKDLPGPLAVDSFVESILQEGGSTFSEPQNRLKLKSRGPQEILELLKTGSGVFDEAIVSWWNKKGEVFFVQLWENIFMSATDAFPERTYTLPEILHDTEDGADAAMAVLLIARKLAIDLPTESGLGKGDLDTSIMEYRQITATRLQAVLADFDQAKVSDVVVLKKESLKKRITVYGPVYRNWLKTGGKNEMLFGLIISGSNALNGTAINLEREKLLREWESFKVLTLSRYKNDQYARFQSCLRTAFYQDLATATEEEKEYGKTNNNHLSKVNELLEKELSGVSISDQNDVYRTVTKLVCKARFYYTDALKILMSIDESTKLNPDMDVKDAETIAAMEYITDFISHQMRVGA